MVIRANVNHPAKIAPKFSSDRFGWGEAADEPGLARQSTVTTAREDARPTKMANCVTSKI